jgi:hypothetical protein
MQSTQPTTVDSVQNKELLWSTLQESGAFAGLTGDQYQPVQMAFDRSVEQAAINVTGPLRDVNKHIIRKFVQTELPMLRSATSQNPTVPKKKKIEMVYRAEDLQTERASEFDRQLREKQAEMDSFLTLKKPNDVSFTDATTVDDKPIGDEMSRLIAQELAARERELVQLKPEDIKRAQQWIGTDTIQTELPLPPPPPHSFKKSVSFSEEKHEVEQFEPNEKMNEFMNGENFEETDFIFSKFKKISEPLKDLPVASLPVASLPVASLPVASLPVASLPIASLSIQQLYNKLLELEQNINAKHAEIMEHLNSKGGVIGEP